MSRSLSLDVAVSVVGGGRRWWWVVGVWGMWRRLRWVEFTSCGRPVSKSGAGRTTERSAAPASAAY